MSIGANIRRMRKAQHLSLVELAQKTGFSAGYISQVETGKVNPSVNSLVNICNALGIQVASLFDGAEEYEERKEDQYIVRAENRKHVLNIEENNEYFFISPDSCKRVQSLIIVAKPGGYSAHGKESHAGFDCGYILSGELEMTIDGDVYHLKAGDSVHFESKLPHKWKNPGPVDCISLWTIVQQ